MDMNSRNKILYAARASRLKKLGYANYDAYLSSEHWLKRRAEFEATHPRKCRYCGEYGQHLHHRAYRNLGAETDEDLEWACAGHHAEITRFGSIQPATERQRSILRDHGYAACFIAIITFGAAFELIGQLGRGEVRSPRELGI